MPSKLFSLRSHLWFHPFTYTSYPIWQQVLQVLVSEYILNLILPFHCHLSLGLLQQLPNRFDHLYPSLSRSQELFSKTVNEICHSFLNPPVTQQLSSGLGLSYAWSGHATSPSQTTLALVLPFLIQASDFLAVSFFRYFPVGSFLHLESSFPSFPLFWDFCKPGLLWTALSDLQWPSPHLLGFPCGSAGKESACNKGDLGSIPGLGRAPGKGNGYPLHGVGKSRTRLSDFHFPLTFYHFTWYYFLWGISYLLISTLLIYFLSYSWTRKISRSNVFHGPKDLRS